MEQQLAACWKKEPSRGRTLCRRGRPGISPSQTFRRSRSGTRLEKVVPKCTEAAEACVCLDHDLQVDCCMKAQISLAAAHSVLLPPPPRPPGADSAGWRNFGSHFHGLVSPSPQPPPSPPFWATSMGLLAPPPPPPAPHIFVGARLQGVSLRGPRPGACPPSGVDPETATKYVQTVRFRCGSWRMSRAPWPGCRRWWRW
jgi:hypothetical protein